MRRREFWRFPSVLLFIVCAINENSTDQRVAFPNSDNNYHGGNGNHLILIFAPGIRTQLNEREDASSSSDISDLSSTEDDIKSSPNDDSAYFLYHILRTTEDNENLDKKLVNTIEETKSVLRPILRARCDKLRQCKRACPKKKINCIKKCVIKIDVYEICERPKSKCKREKCGMTLPPKWRMK
ncbi:unnamed protein product, partial [Iphiclides podalirius]